MTTARRAPYQILVLPFREARGLDEVEFAILQGADDGSWQGVAGGGHEGESVVEAARRELVEEAGVSPSVPLYPMVTRDAVPAYCFAARIEWPPDVYVVPQHFFACDLTGMEIVLSSEHSEVRWSSYHEAAKLLRYDSNKTALWELAERLRRHDLPEAV